MSDDYEVGYRKPPRHSRFKKGRSGNPKGRPKGTKNLKSDLQEELQERILVREGDRAVTISKQRAIVKSLVAKTLKGDSRSATTLLAAMFRLLDVDGTFAAPDQPFNTDEKEAFAMLEARVLRKADTAAKRVPLKESGDSAP
jgi:hypothetical protein